MPNVVMTNPVTYENVTRPVALGVIREVARVLRLPGDINVVFAGGAETVANTGSTLTGDPNDSVFSHNLLFTVEVQERAVEDRILTLHAHENEQYPIFADTDLGIAIRPIYSMTEQLISFKVRFPNRVVAQRFRDDVLTRLAMLRQEDNHEITYHYSIPNPFLHLLRDLHGLRENVAPYGESFSQWMNAHLDSRATLLTNVAGKRSLLAFPETQTRIWGTFSDLTAMAESAQKDGESGRWTISFDYRWQYDKPIACKAHWPLVVHNQFVPEPWFDMRNASGHMVDHWVRKERPSYSREAFDRVATQDEAMCEDRFQPTIIPVMDDWSTPAKIPDLQLIVQALIGVNPQTPTVAMDLKELDDYQWDPDVLSFMRSEAPYMTRYGHSVFHVSLYRGDRLQAPEALSVTSELAVVSANPLNLREVHHVRVHGLTDLFFLNDAGRQRLIQSGVVGQKILTQLQLLVHSKAYVPRVINGLVVMEDYQLIARRLQQHKRPYELGRDSVMLTHGLYTIVTRRKLHGASEADDFSPTASGTGPTEDSRQLVSRCDS